ncbi:MAG: hypothetical protein WDN45_16400 [Caulobacteraceae bacterium]
MANPLGQLVLFGLTVSLFYHLANGVRHLWWDVGEGFDPKVADMDGGRLHRLWPGGRRGRLDRGPVHGSRLMVSYRTPLGRARGLGSAKHGAGHWISERVTSIALVPLSLWAVCAAWPCPRPASTVRSPGCTRRSTRCCRCSCWRSVSSTCTRA